MCAERVAIFIMCSRGAQRVQAVAVAGPDGVTALPCGACRQVLARVRARGCRSSSTAARAARGAANEPVARGVRRRIRSTRSRPTAFRGGTRADRAHLHDRCDRLALAHARRGRQDLHADVGRARQGGRGRERRSPDAKRARRTAASCCPRSRDAAPRPFNLDHHLIGPDRPHPWAGSGRAAQRSRRRRCWRKSSTCFAKWICRCRTSTSCWRAAAGALAVERGPASLVPRFELRLLHALGLGAADDVCASLQRRFQRARRVARRRSRRLGVRALRRRVAATSLT